MAHVIKTRTKCLGSKAISFWWPPNKILYDTGQFAFSVGKSLAIVMGNRAVNLSERIRGRMHRIVHFLNLHQIVVKFVFK